MTLYGMFTVRIVPRAFHIQAVEGFWNTGIILLDFQMRKLRITQVIELVYSHTMNIFWAPKPVFSVTMFIIINSQ